MQFECENITNYAIGNPFETAAFPTSFLLDLKGILIRPILYTDGSPGLNAVAERSLLLVHTMAYLLNFTIKPVYGDDWITVGQDGSLEGVGKLLEESVGDLLCQTHELTIERAEKLQFVFPTVTHREEAFFRQPSRIYENIIFRPFSMNLKLAFLGAAAALALVMWMILNFNRKMLNSYDRCNNLYLYRTNTNFRCRTNQETFNYTWRFHEIKQTTEESFLWVIALFTQQGGWLETAGNGKFQILSILGLSISLVANSMYSAKILSIIKARDAPITSFSGLVASGMEIFVDKDAQNEFRILKELMVPPNDTTFIEMRTMHADDGLPRILQKNNGTAFLSYRFYMDNAARKLGEKVFLQFCNSVSSVLPNPRGLQVYNGMYVRKYSPLRKIFRYSLIRIKERGLMESVIQSEYVSTSKNWCKVKVGEIESLPYSVTAPCFTLLLISMLLAMIELILENIWDKLKT